MKLFSLHHASIQKYLRILEANSQPFITFHFVSIKIFVVDVFNFYTRVFLSWNRLENCLGQLFELGPDPLCLPRSDFKDFLRWVKGVLK